MTTHNIKNKLCDFAGCCCRIEKHKTYCKKHQELKDFQNQLKHNTGRKYDLTSMFATGLEVETKKPITIDTGHIEKQEETKQKVIRVIQDYIVFDKELNLVAKKCEYKKDIESFYFENDKRYKIIKRKLPDGWDVISVYHNGEFYKKMTVDEIVETYKLQRGTVVWRLRVGGVERRKMHIKRQPLAELLTNEMQKIKAQIEIEKHRIDTLMQKKNIIIDKQDYSHLSREITKITVKEKLLPLKQRILNTIKQFQEHKAQKEIANIKQKHNQDYIDFLKKKKFKMLCFVECDSEEYQAKLKTFFKDISKEIQNTRGDNEK